ncbi:MAG: phosphoenolpyruvate--protein phosphotransferase [Acidothermaceae bacterium]
MELIPASAASSTATATTADSSAAASEGPDARQLHGVPVSPGVARGPVVRMGDPLPAPSDRPSNRPAPVELATANAAMSGVAADLRARASAAEQPVRGVLDAQALMAEDPALSDDVARRIDAGATAARAIWEAFGVFHDALRRGGGYLAERVDDLDDVRNRIVASCLRVALPEVPAPGFPFVLIARTLSPADTASLRADQVLAIVTVEGSATSHTAILARTLGIPAVVGCADVTVLADGTHVQVDGNTGLVEVSQHLSAEAPGAIGAASGTVASVAGVSRGGSSGHFSVTAEGLGGSRTADGVAIALMANIGSPDEAAPAAAVGAEGIGLLRTEFLYLRAGKPPSVAEQEAALRKVLAEFESQLVVVRLLDAGGDKPLPFLATSDEPNPALGVRGLRALRTHDRILDDQLDAIAQAAAASSARVAVMAPMVTDARDAEWFRSRVQAHRGWPGDIAIGVMIETPAAALTADNVLAASDFASIGTNDLTQYVMAADRSLGVLSGLQNPWHPAVLELVAMAAEAGGRQAKPVGVCGEAAADPLLALVLVGLGVTSLSMTWSAIEGVRARLAQYSFAECSSLAAAALAGHDADDAKARVLTVVG